MGDFHAQVLANTAWAFATASQDDASLFAALATAAKQRLGDFNSQHLVNTAWALATASQDDVSLLAALATAAKQCLGDFNSRVGVPRDVADAAIRESQWTALLSCDELTKRPPKGLREAAPIRFAPTYKLSLIHI